MKYILFAYDDYYPAGGAFDAVYKSDDRDELVRIADKLTQIWDSAHIFDVEKFRVVYRTWGKDRFEEIKPTGAEIHL